MALAVVQHSGAIHGSQNPPTAVTLGAAPTAGNLLIAFVGLNLNSYTVNASGWTQFDACQNGLIAPGSQNNTVMVALYRYVQGGDTATLPVFFTAASTYWTHQIWEVSGVSGTWATDYLCSFPMTDIESNVAICPLPIFTAGLALTGTASYNGGSNPSITGSWTLDDSNNNNGIFGSAAGAHRVVANGDTLDGAWTQGTSSPYGAFVLLLTTQQPSAGVYPRHVYRCGGTTGFTSSITLPLSQITGDLVIAYFVYGAGPDGSPTINATGWTEFASKSNGFGKRISALYRYVQGGDGTSLPAIATAAGAFVCLQVVHLAGAAGVFATDHVSNKINSQDTGASITTTSDLTTANNQFALCAFGNYNGGSAPSQSGFAGTLTDNSSGGYGAYLLAFKFYSASGSTVQGTLTPALTTTVQSYSQDIFQRGAGAINASVNLTGVSAAGAAGSFSIEVDVSLTLTGVSSAGAVGSLVQNPNILLAGVSAAGAPGIATPAYDRSVALSGAHATGASGAVGGNDEIDLSGVSAFGGPGVVVAQPEKFDYFPVLRLMRSTPVPTIGAMGDEPVVTIGALPASGIKPISLAVNLVGVSAAGAQAHINILRNVRVPLVGVASQGSAGLVVAA